MAGDFTYDPDDYLGSTMTSIQGYVAEQLASVPSLVEGVDVEMSFPNTAEWTKASPLERPLVHFELDDDPAMILGFGTPQIIDDDGTSDTVTVNEPQQHMLNFDVGVWTSKQAGGPPKRAQVRKALFDIFGYAANRVLFTTATDGLVIKGYGGGGDLLDRINDLPVFRTTGITLIVSVFSRLTHTDPVSVVLDVDQRQKLSIIDEDGNLEQLVTDESHWT